MATRRVTLTPSAGFCIKTTLQSPHSLPSSKEVFPVGSKLFLNIAYDPLVPPPPTGTTPEAIAQPDYVLPLIIGDLREDVDKKGQRSLVVDCIYSKDLKSKVIREEDFKEFIALVALERTEQKHSLDLSRSIGTPNIASKGKLDPRSVIIPVYGSSSKLPATASPTDPSPNGTSDEQPRKPLIEELESTEDNGAPPAPKIEEQKPEKPKWSISTPTSEAEPITLTISMPNATKSHISDSTLDVESRRIILDVPPFYSLDEVFSVGSVREFNVQKAKAEWHVKSGSLLLTL